MDEKSVFLENEGDAWWTRNKENLLYDKNYMSKASKKLAGFLTLNKTIEKNHILEVGCSAGYNLIHLYNILEGENTDAAFYYGVDPSKEAIEYGTRVIKEKKCNIQLDCATADQLPYKDECMDCVIVGFCMFWWERKYLFRSIAEIDRVLKTGGILVLEDFDTTIPYIRNNIHNSDVFTYKMDYSKFFLANPQYNLIEKYSYSHLGKEFHKEIQERISTCIIYKDSYENTYILNKDTR